MNFSMLYTFTYSNKSYAPTSSGSTKSIICLEYLRKLSNQFQYKWNEMNKERKKTNKYPHPQRQPTSYQQQQKY